MPPISIRPAVQDPTAQAEKTIQRATNAAGDWLAGIKSPRRDPKAQAIKGNATYKNAMQVALAADAYLHGVQNMDVDAMLATLDLLGTGVYTAGLAARKSKLVAKLTKMAPLLTAHKAKMDSMPTATDSDRQAKMIANLQGMKEIGKQLAGIR